MLETVGTILSSTSFSARSRIVQRLRPAGAFEQASWISRASNSPSKTTERGGRSRSLRCRASSNPRSTKRALRCSSVRGVIPSASAASATFHFGPCSPASSKSKARACSTVLAGLTPVVDSDSSISRSSAFNVTRYRGAMNTSLGRVWRHDDRSAIYTKYYIIRCTRAFSSILQPFCLLH